MKGEERETNENISSSFLPILLILFTLKIIIKKGRKKEDF